MGEINFTTPNGATVYIAPGGIPAGTFVTVEGFDHPPQDANGVWGLSPLVALNVNGGMLNSPAMICIPLADLPATATVASWVPGDNGGIFTPVPTSIMGGFACTNASMTGTFGLVDQGFFR